MTTALAKAKKKLMDRSIAVTVMKVKLPSGETVGALVPDHEIDRRSLRERKFHTGKQLRAKLSLSRNPGFWRKAHVLAGWLADNVEQFEGLGQHDALKRLQELSGIGCETVEYDIPGVGKLTRTEAESLNFETVDEGQFQTLWTGWVEWLRREVWGDLDRISVDQVEEIIETPDASA